MRDEGLVAKKKLTRSQRAVKYLLDRIRVDADLRWKMLGTEAFALLCAAEAKRRGKLKEHVREKYSQPAEHCRGDRAQIVELREEVTKLQEKLARQTPDGYEALLGKYEALRDKLADRPVSSDTAAIERLLEFIRERDGYSVACAAQAVLRAELEIEVRL